MGTNDVSPSAGTGTVAATGGQEDGSAEYLPPRLVRLGSLAELTLGGKGDPDDGFGGAGDEGSV